VIVYLPGVTEDGELLNKKSQTLAEILTQYLQNVNLTVKYVKIVEELETNLMSLVMFITLNICSTCFEHSGACDYNGGLPHHCLVL